MLGEDRTCLFCGSVTPVEGKLFDERLKVHVIEGAEQLTCPMSHILTVELQIVEAKMNKKENKINGN